MSTNRARSFGLAIIVAIGVIAAMAAMGLFSTGPAHAQENIPATKVIFTPPSLDINDTGNWTVEFTRGANVSGLRAADTIVIEFPLGVGLPTDFDNTEVTLEVVVQNIH